MKARERAREKESKRAREQERGSKGEWKRRESGEEVIGMIETSSLRLSKYEKLASKC